MADAGGFAPPARPRSPSPEKPYDSFDRGFRYFVKMQGNREVEELDLDEYIHFRSVYRILVTRLTAGETAGSWPQNYLWKVLLPSVEFFMTLLYKRKSFKKRLTFGHCAVFNTQTRKVVNQCMSHTGLNQMLYEIKRPRGRIQNRGCVDQNAEADGDTAVGG